MAFIPLWVKIPRHAWQVLKPGIYECTPIEFRTRLVDEFPDSERRREIYGYRLNPKRPHDWIQPVDFRNGTVHIRTEVLERPESDEAVQWSLCYIPNRGQGNGYGCTGTDRSPTLRSFFPRKCASP